MKYQFKVAISFWEQFNALPAPQQSSARAKLRIFKDDSLDPRLRTHKINSLSASFKTTVFAVCD